MLNGPNHTANLYDGRVYEMTGAGCKDTELQEWLRKTNRKSVKVLRPEEFELVERPKRYDHFGLVQMLFQLVKWWLKKKLGLDIGGTWNGRDGVPMPESVAVCTKYSALCAKRPNPHLYTPEAFLNDPSMELVGEFSTRQGVGIVSGSLPIETKRQPA
ncbi:hypothetical protein GCM10023183_08510 [Nibribacter koreensis]|uniref:Uncharacterized protein n=1 Tax=Nibribacter koreensis TaxID=1084519 RepID=A0ABP8FAZ5_9BACT